MQHIFCFVERSLLFKNRRHKISTCQVYDTAGILPTDERLGPNERGSDGRSRGFSGLTRMDSPAGTAEHKAERHFLCRLIGIGLQYKLDYCFVLQIVLVMVIRTYALRLLFVAFSTAHFHIYF